MRDAGVRALESATLPGPRQRRGPARRGLRLCGPRSWPRWAPHPEPHLGPFLREPPVDPPHPGRRGCVQRQVVRGAGTCFNRECRRLAGSASSALSQVWTASPRSRHPRPYQQDRGV